MAAVKMIYHRVGMCIYLRRARSKRVRDWRTSSRPRGITIKNVMPVFKSRRNHTRHHAIVFVHNKTPRVCV